MFPDSLQTNNVTSLRFKPEQTVNGKVFA